jgi:hypothetical protein
MATNGSSQSGARQARAGLGFRTSHPVRNNALGQAHSPAVELVHQVSDWGSGVAIKMGRRQGATKEHI